MHYVFAEKYIEIYIKMNIKIAPAKVIIIKTIGQNKTHFSSDQ
jgi:hypothetical protein